VGARVGLQLPRAGTWAAQVEFFDGRTLVLELSAESPEADLKEGSVVDMFLSLSWGMYKWLCIVSASSGDGKAEVQLLDAPMFIQRRLDPRVGVGLRAQVRPVRSPNHGQPFDAVVADLSHGGLKLQDARSLSAGDVIKVTLDLSATSISTPVTISLVGRVVTAYPSNEGDVSVNAHVSFLDGQQKAIEAVDQFVAQQLKCRWQD
jgi:hypothetical protein